MAASRGHVVILDGASMLPSRSRQNQTKRTIDIFDKTNLTLFVINFIDSSNSFLERDEFFIKLCFVIWNGDVIYQSQNT